MASENFLRTYTLRCGPNGGSGFEIGNVNGASETVLHVSFSIEKSDAETSNTAKVQIWNLSDANLKILDLPDCILELKAGYGGNDALVLVGNIVSAITTRDNADRMTEIEVVDGRVELRDTYLSLSYNGPVNCQELYQETARQMGVSIVFAQDLSFKVLPNGFTYIGKAWTLLQKIAECCGHQWTMQNQILQITLPGMPLNTVAYVLSSDTGLINIPKRITISSGKDSKESQTGYEVEYLLNGAIGINDVVDLRSKDLNGYFRVYKVTIDGDNMEGDWACTAQVLEIKSQAAA